MVQLRTNFCSQQIRATFWFNIEQNFLECRTDAVDENDLSTSRENIIIEDVKGNDKSVVME